MLGIFLIPVFALFEQILFPTGVGFKCAFKVHLLLFGDVINLDEGLLAIPHVDGGIVGYCVSRTINELLLILYLFEDHRSHILLLVSY